MKNPSTAEISKPFFRAFYRHNRLNWTFTVLFTLLCALENAVISWLLGEIIDATSALEGLRLRRLLLLTLTALGCILLVDWGRAVSRTRLVRRGMTQYKDLAFEKLSQKSISAFDRERTGRYLSILTNDIAAIETDYLLGLPALLYNAVSAAVALAVMLRYSPAMTLAVLVLCLPSLLASVLMGGETAARAKAVSDRGETFVSRLRDLLAGFSVIKSFKAEGEVRRLFNADDRALEDTKARRRWWSYLVQMAGNSLGIVLQFGTFFVGAALALRGQLTPGAVLIFVNLCNPLIQAIGQIPQYWAEYRAARGLVEKLAQAVEENVLPAGAPVEPVLRDAIRLRDVTFGYDPEKPVLRDVSLTLEAGRKYALVGPSGSGKSTLLHLLMGGCTGYTGSVTVDGRELRDIDPDSLYDLLSRIDQSVFLFDDTLEHNITLFREFPRADLHSAVERAGLSDLLAEKGADWPCGENGAALSGGERQRVSIARTLLRSTPVLLLDEATASLDAQTAREVTESILALDGLTRLVVTHRLDPEVLERYDEIFVLQNGRVRERGTCRELMERKGALYALCTLAA